MCDFISWYEVNGEVLYVNDAVLRSKEGREFQQKHYKKYPYDLTEPPAWQVEEHISQYYDDIIGHGAILSIWLGRTRSKYNQYEVTEFSYPGAVAHIPDVIKKDILEGKFRRVGFDPRLLNAKSKKDFSNFKNDRRTEYVDLVEELDDNYSKITGDRIWDPEYGCWKEQKHGPSLSTAHIARVAEFNDFKMLLFEITNEYWEDVLDYFWDLFEDKTNRNHIWRSMKI